MTTWDRIVQAQSMAQAAQAEAKQAQAEAAYWKEAARLLMSTYTLHEGAGTLRNTHTWQAIRRELIK